MKYLLTASILALAASAATAAGTLTDAQVDAAFAKADPDKDGTLDAKEAAKFGIAAALLKKADPDNDGTLDKKEFAAAITERFNAADPDKDGTLDRREARKAGVRGPMVFKKADPDKDGTLDLGEYLSALTAQIK